VKEIKRQARVHWAGGLQDGRGEATTESKVLDGEIFSAPSRFDQGQGTNPEELIAAAQASCFSMMLAKILGDQKRSLEQIDTNATVVLRQENGSAKISEIHLKTQAKVIGINADEFQKAAEQAKENCPVSVLLKPGVEKITLEASLA
jgi:osmotically inducible protein OsmC